MKIAVWLYFVALTILCVSASMGAYMVGRIIHRLCGSPSALPALTEVVIEYHAVLYLVPVPSLLAAIFVSVKPGVDQSRVSIIGAYTLVAMATVLLVTVLPLIIPFVPWCIVLDPAK
jgi:hypothetical protein